MPSNERKKLINNPVTGAPNGTDYPTSLGRHMKDIVPVYEAGSQSLRVVNPSIRDRNTLPFVPPNDYALEFEE
jgi:hypothetical protein